MPEGGSNLAPATSEGERVGTRLSLDGCICLMRQEKNGVMDEKLWAREFECPNPRWSRLQLEIEEEGLF
jgi:hypothetical protein